VNETLTSEPKAKLLAALASKKHPLMHASYFQIILFTNMANSQHNMLSYSFIIWLTETVRNS